MRTNAMIGVLAPIAVTTKDLKAGRAEIADPLGWIVIRWGGWLGRTALSWRD